MGAENKKLDDIMLSIQVSTIPELLLARAKECGEHIAISEKGHSISYSDLPKHALAVSKALIARGVSKGDRVAIWAPNCLDWVVVALGIHCAGAVLVPINTRMKGREAADIIERSGSRYAFVVGQFLGVDYPAMLADFHPRNLDGIVVLGSPENEHPDDSLESFLSSGGAEVSEQAVLERANSLKANDLSDLLFTSGTTGKPKGVMSGHGQTLKAFSVYSNTIGLAPEDKYLVVNPFFHCFGYKAGWLSGLISGATVLPHAVFDAEEIFERVETERVTILPGPPTLYLSMLEQPRLKEADISSLRVAVTGASSIPPVLIERLRNELGFSVVTTAYGLTECGGIATICDPDEPAEIIASTSGQAIPETELCIMDATGEVLPSGEVGEVCLKGFHVMQGYFNDPVATEQAIDKEGWLHTGDVGYLDDRGNLTITDRLKDMFIMGGFNCYPAEIEAALYEHPDIAMAAVFGVPDQRFGEVGRACVVLMPGSDLTEETLIEWSRKNMANYKVPRSVKFLSELPKNASNKIDKAKLRAM
ncbi:FadD3 family acyl-CoA ligase [uncultured Marinobacter sp.]|uniref:FadD3 family acyl-CoA ligase n=1 Tax=uncultured Marinobacter sp. TaxID=187379 RepID=UPI00260BF5FB|nr:FadD3 family acyl-CoA ligase [uncultured Marinobacter sp.]